MARSTFFFGFTRSEMASMVRASSARVRSMSATSVVLVDGLRFGIRVSHCVLRSRLRSGQA